MSKTEKTYWSDDKYDYESDATTWDDGSGKAVTYYRERSSVFGAWGVYKREEWDPPKSG